MPAAGHDTSAAPEPTFPALTVGTVTQAALRRAIRIPCFPNKYQIPAQYWRDLAGFASRSFILVGQTNKSWLRRDAEQRTRFGIDLLRLATSGGEVLIISNTRRDIIDDTSNFLNNALEQWIAETQIDAAESGTIVARIRYCATSEIHYQAVRSDSRLVLLPLPNTIAFREEAMVLELSEADHPEQFRHYVDDLSRLASESERILWR